MVKQVVHSFFVLFLLFAYAYGQPRLHVIDVPSPTELHRFFRYAPQGMVLVSAHRGGPGKGYPENCIATFEHMLSQTHAMIEIDPRFTKDGQIVLMHDPTLDRTTNGSGKVSDYTLQELKMLWLKDTEGNLTEYRIPTLDEVLQWAKGKTILVIDEKDVPMEVRIRKITEHKAEAYATVIAYSVEDIQEAYALNQAVMMEVMAGKPSQLDALDTCGVPWQNMIAFISHNLPVDTAMVRQIHKRGALCMQGSSRNVDKQFVAGEIDAATLQKGYQMILHSGVDIIEADLPVEAGKAVNVVNSERNISSFLLQF